MEIKTICYGSEEYFEALAFRDAIMRAPLGLSIYDEQLSSEQGDTILCGYIDGEIMATTIVTPLFGKSAKLRQVAVAKKYRAQGYGKAIVLAAIAAARALSYNEVTLDSRLNAVNFYKRLGFASYGEIFEEVGLAHIRMRRAV